jgi:hypothetical protein
LWCCNTAKPSSSIDILYSTAKTQRSQRIFLLACFFERKKQANNLPLAEFKILPPEKLRPLEFGIGYAVKNGLERRKATVTVA